MRDQELRGLPRQSQATRADPKTEFAGLSTICAVARTPGAKAI